MNTVWKYVRKNAVYWVIAFAASVLLGAFAANESHAQAQAGSLKTTTTSFTMDKSNRIIFTDPSGNYAVGQSWKSGQVVGTLDYYGDTVYLIEGKTGTMQCPEKWVVLLTGKTPSDSQIWTLPTCTIKDVMDFDITVNTISVVADNKVYSFEP